MYTYLLRQLRSTYTLTLLPLSVVGPLAGEVDTPEAREVLAQLAALQAPSGADAAPEQQLKGLRVVISAGPTYEDLDPVRYVGNRSSGKMGFAVAASAAPGGIR